MRILHITTGYPLSFHGGITNYVRSIAEVQTAEGHQVGVVSGKAVPVAGLLVPEDGVQAGHVEQGDQGEQARCGHPVVHLQRSLSLTTQAVSFTSVVLPSRVRCQCSVVSSAKTMGILETNKY